MGAQLPHRTRSEAPAINFNLLLATSGTGGPQSCRRIGVVYRKVRWSALRVEVGLCFSGLPVSMALCYTEVTNLEDAAGRPPVAPVHHSSSKGLGYVL